MLLLALSLSSPVHARCDQPTQLAELREAYTRGEQAFAELDLAALNAADEVARGTLECLSEPITPSDAAAFHRLMGLTAFANLDRERVSSEFHAARKLEPGYSFPPELAPEGHPLLEAYARAVLLDEGELVTPFPPVGGYVTVGGVRGAPRASASPAVVQVFDSSGAVLETLYVGPGDRLPEWGPKPLPERSTDHRIPLIFATGSTLIASGALYGVAQLSEKQFWDPNTPTAELPELRQRTNSMAFGGLAFGVLAVGLGTITVVTW